MKIDINHLDPDTLTNIIEAFVLREGTDYGMVEVSLADKINQIKEQLLNGDLLLLYSELHQTVNIVAKNQFQ